MTRESWFELEIDREFDAILVPVHIPVQALFEQTPPPPQKRKSPSFLPKYFEIFGSLVRRLISRRSRPSKRQSQTISSVGQSEQLDETCTDANREFTGTSHDGGGSANSSTVAVSLADEYNMRHKRRGCFIIFNHMRFQPHLDVGTRLGTNKDSENLERTAHKLGFDYVRIFNDFCKNDIVKSVSQIAQSDHCDCDCFAMAVLTHGASGNMLYAHDEKYHLDQLIQPFTAKNCLTLAGKPKLFFIQACRGDMFDDGAPAPIGDVVDAVVAPEPIKHGVQTRNIPNAADFLLAFSTVPGYCSWRHQLSGSWFIQSLCKCLTDFGDEMEILQIMTKVNKMVAFEFASSSQHDLRFHNKRQIPSIESRLTHGLFFRKKNENDVESSEMTPMLQDEATSNHNSNEGSDDTKCQKMPLRRLTL